MVEATGTGCGCWLTLRGTRLAAGARWPAAACSGCLRQLQNSNWQLRAWALFRPFYSPFPRSLPPASFPPSLLHSPTRVPRSWALLGGRRQDRPGRGCVWAQRLQARVPGEPDRLPPPSTAVHRLPPPSTASTGSFGATRGSGSPKISSRAPQDLPMFSPCSPVISSGRRPHRLELPRDALRVRGRHPPGDGRRGQHCFGWLRLASISFGWLLMASDGFCWLPLASDGF